MLPADAPIVQVLKRAPVVRRAARAAYRAYREAAQQLGATFSAAEQQRLVDSAAAGYRRSAAGTATAHYQDRLAQVLLQPAPCSASSWAAAGYAEASQHRLLWLGCSDVLHAAPMYSAQDRPVWKATCLPDPAP